MPDPTNTAPLMLCAGEALTDMIDQGGEQWLSRVGGSVWNVARALAVLGEPTAFAGAVSCDRFGDALWSASEEVGLNLGLMQRVERSPLLAVVEKSEPPRYFFIGDDSADLHFDPEALPAEWLDSLRWAHFGGISLAREPLAGNLVALAESLKAQGVRISYDPNFRALMDERYDPTLRRMTLLADVIKVSEEDLVGLLRTQDADAAFATLRAWNPEASYLYTKGAQGASLHTPDGSWTMPAPRIEPVDTVGAGDASMAALAWSMLHRQDAGGLDHLRFAVAAGAAACLAAGATPPSLDAIDRLIAQMA